MESAQGSVQNEGTQQGSPAKRVHFVSLCKGGDPCSPPSPDLSGWKIGTSTVEACTPPSAPALAGPDATPGSAAWLASARKVDDLCSRLQELEEALRGMEARAVAQLDKQLQEKVLATAMKLVERRLNHCQLDKKIEEQVQATAIKMLQQQQQQHASADDDGAQDGALRKKLNFAPEEDSTAKPVEPVGAEVLEQFATHIESGLGQVVRRMEKKVDALQWLLDNDVIGALEARVGEALGALDARVAALEKAQTEAQGPAHTEAGAQLEPAGAVERESPTAGGLSPIVQAEKHASPASQEDSQEAKPAFTLRQRRPAAKLGAASPAGVALLGALQSAKEQVARSEAAAAEATGNRGSWWASALHALAWALLMVLGLAACLACMNVAMKTRGPSNDFLS